MENKQNWTFIRKYRNRKYYSRKHGMYLTSDQIWEMLLAGETFVIFDEKTGKEVSARTVLRFLAEQVPQGYTMTPEVARFIADCGGLIGVLEKISGHPLKFDVTLDTSAFNTLGSKDVILHNREVRHQQFLDAEEKIDVTVRAIEAMKSQASQVTLPAPEGR